jgi:hypothetical protein
VFNVPSSGAERAQIHPSSRFLAPAIAAGIVPSRRQSVAVLGAFPPCFGQPPTVGREDADDQVALSKLHKRLNGNCINLHGLKIMTPATLLRTLCVADIFLYVLHVCIACAYHVLKMFLRCAFNPGSVWPCHRIQNKSEAKERRGCHYFQPMKIDTISV